VIFVALRALGDERTGVIARPVAKAVVAVDQWDVLLCLGVVLLGAGVWITWGMGVAFIVGGALLALGGLWGARSSVSSTET
jgi:hypothetical protein